MTLVCQVLTNCLHPLIPPGVCVFPETLNLKLSQFPTKFNALFPYDTKWTGEPCANWWSVNLSLYTPTFGHWRAELGMLVGQSTSLFYCSTCLPHFLWCSVDFPMFCFISAVVKLKWVSLLVTLTTILKDFHI